MQIVTALLFLLLPAGIIYLSHHQGWARRIGVIVLCYLLGLVIGGIGLVPESARAVPGLLSELTIVFALPLLLFSLDLRQWSRVAGKALLSMLFAVTAVTGLATLLFFAYRDGSGAAAQLAAMSVGVYSGGTPNLAAIKAGLEIPNGLYLSFHSLDAVVEVEGVGSVTLDAAYGGDSYALADARALGFELEPSEARDILGLRIRGVYGEREYRRF